MISLMYHSPEEKRMLNDLADRKILIDEKSLVINRYINRRKDIEQYKNKYYEDAPGAPVMRIETRFLSIEPDIIPSIIYGNNVIRHGSSKDCCEKYFSVQRDINCFDYALTKVLTSKKIHVKYYINQKTRFLISADNSREFKIDDDVLYSIESDKIIIEPKKSFCYFDVYYQSGDMFELWPRDAIYHNDELWMSCIQSDSSQIPYDIYEDIGAYEIDDENRWI